MFKVRVWLLKQVLTVLSITPIASVAFAASSRLSDGDFQLPQGLSPDALSQLGPDSVFTAQDLSDPLFVSARRSLFRGGERRKTHAEAYEYFLTRSGELGEAEAAEEFYLAIKLLKSKGMITVNEKEIISSIPSGDGITWF